MIFSVAVSLCLLCFVRESSETLVNLSKISYGYTGGMDNNKLTFQNGVPGYGMKLSCTNCVKIRDNKVVCEVGKVVNVTVTLSKWKAYLNIPFDVSCDTSKNVATTNYLSGTPMVHSVNLSWVVTDPSIDKYIIYLMEDTKNLHTIIKTKKGYYLLENLREKTQYGICVATIDPLSRTGEYRCVEVQTDFSETGPVRDIVIIPTLHFVRISWTKPEYEKDSPSGYIVRYTDSEGTCGETIISMGQTPIVSKSPCTNKKNEYWMVLQSLTIDKLRPNTLYTLVISPVNGEKTRRSTKTTCRTVEGESGPVLGLRLYNQSDHLYIEYKEPKHTNGIVTKYRVKVVLQRRGMCEETNTIVLGPKDISEVHLYVPKSSLEKCARYSIEVSPINGWSHNGGLGRSSSVVFVSPPGSTSHISNISATFTSTNMLRVFWNKTGINDDCPKIGFVVEIVNMRNESDCAARVHHDEDCEEVRIISQKGPKCEMTDVKKRYDSGGSWTVHIGRQFHPSRWYRVKIWRITDVAILEKTLSPIRAVERNCFTDCYSTVYGGIRSDTDCILWNTTSNRYNMARNSLCIMGEKKQPWCFTTDSWKYCTVPACLEVHSSSGCVGGVQLTVTTTQVKLTWNPPDHRIPIGYVTLLYDTEHSCEQSHISICRDCAKEADMRLAVENFHWFCRSKTETRDVVRDATFWGLHQDKEYHVYVVPLISTHGGGEVRNISFRTSLARPDVPKNIKSVNKSMTTLSFSWDKQTDYSRWGRQQYYEVVLLKTNVRIDSKRVHNEEVEFTNLDVYAEYCVEVYATNKAGHSKSKKVQCQQTKAPKLGNVFVDDVESGTSLERVLTWRYSDKDKFSKSYMVRYRNKFVDLEEEYVVTSDTSVRITNLRKNMIYGVSVRVETNMDTVDGNKMGEYSLDKEFYTGTMRPEIHGYKEYLSPNRELLNISWSFNTSYEGSVFEFILLVKNTSGSGLESTHFMCQDCPEPYIWTNLNETSKVKRRGLLYKEITKTTFKKDIGVLNGSFTMKKSLTAFSVEIYAINLIGVHNVFVVRRKMTRPDMPRNIKNADSSMTTLSFVWNKQTDYTNWGRPEYYEIVLRKSNVKMDSKIEHNEMVEFTNLEVCSEYCVEVYATNKEGASQSAKSKCQQTKAPKLGNVNLDDVESGSSSERALWWRYSEKDNCPRSYRVRYRNKYVDIEDEYRETNDTKFWISNLRRNTIYTVSVRVETNMDTVDGTKKGEYTIDKEFYTGKRKPEIYRYKEYLSPSRERISISWSFCTFYDGSIFEFIALVKNSYSSYLSFTHLVCKDCPEPYIWTNLNETSRIKRRALLDMKEGTKMSFKRSNDTIHSYLTVKKPLTVFSVEIYAINLLGVHNVTDDVRTTK